MQQFQDDIFRLKMRADKMEKVFEEKVQVLSEALLKLEERVAHLEAELERRSKGREE